MIVDYLYDDKPSLRRCGLVCRSWLPSSRFHLFSTLRLIVGTDISVLCALGSSIPPYVRNLDVNIRNSGWRPDPIGTPWFSETLLKLPRMPAIQGLSLTNVAWDLVTLEAKERLFTLTSGLKSLSLDCMRFGTLGQAIECIASAPLLERLQMGNIKCHSEDVSLTPFTAPPLKEIIFRVVCTPVMFRWLRFWQPIPSVYSLSFDIFRSGDIRSIAAADYVKFLGPILEHLQLHSNSSQRREAHRMSLHFVPPSRFLKVIFTENHLYNEFDLAQNVSLRTITFDLWGKLSGSGAQHWIISILSQITSRHIKRVTLNIFLDSLAELTVFDPPALAALFISGGSTFAEQATRLRIGISGVIGRVEGRMAIREAFRELDSQGRLEIRVRWDGSEL